jgi:hypothetical protein
MAALIALQHHDFRPRYVLWYYHKSSILLLYPLFPTSLVLYEIKMKIFSIKKNLYVQGILHKNDFHGLQDLVRV